MWFDSLRCNAAEKKNIQMKLPEINIEDFNITRENEGYSAKLYKCTAGKLTIGWGHNIEDKGISIDEAELMFKNDIYDAIHDLAKIFPDIYKMEKNVRIVLVDMMFNLGYNKFSGFKKFIEAIKNGDKETAKKEMVDSAYYKQVGKRGQKLLELLN